MNNLETVGTFNNKPIYFNGDYDKNKNIYLVYDNKKLPYNAILRMLPYDATSHLNINKKGDRF